MEIRTIICIIAATLILSACPWIDVSSADDVETEIALSDSGITVDGSPVSEDASSAVYIGAEIIYYEEGTNSSYGEGDSSDMHTAAEAAKHTVVTITKAGTYRISGTLSYGQIAVDASDDDTVTLILDNVNITCTVAPAVIFYNVLETGDSSTATTAIPDTAGANVIIEDGSVNNINGSHVAKIYQTGTTKKLYKFDAAFYSKMSMIISGGTVGNGVLNIVSDNEGLDAELHLTINSGVINITSQDDGINTNEDGISVTKINGGTLFVNAGLGTEGDGIDSNGYLIINGGTIVTMANPQTGDGGIDADMAILINGGTVAAFGSRNDSTDSKSEQPYIELTYATTQSANTIIHIEDASGNVLLTCSPSKAYQSFTFSSPELRLNTSYYLYSGGSCSGTLSYGLYTDGTYSGGTLMKYTGNSSNMMPGMTRPGQQQTGTGSSEFTLSSSTKTFSGVTVSSEQSVKKTVSISIDGLTDNLTISSISVKYNGSTLDISNIIQVTIQDEPSESYFKTALLSDGLETLNAMLPTEAGTYSITIAVSSTSASYEGSYQYVFEVDENGIIVNNNENDSGNTDGGSGVDWTMVICIAGALAMVLALIVGYKVTKDRKG